MKSGGDKNNTGVAAALIITCSPLVLASHPFVRRRPSRQNHQPSEQQSSGGGKTKDIFRIFIINKNGLWFIMFVKSQGNKSINLGKVFDWNRANRWLNFNTCKACSCVMHHCMMLHRFGWRENQLLTFFLSVVELSMWILMQTEERQRACEPFSQRLSFFLTPTPQKALLPFPFLHLSYYLHHPQSPSFLFCYKEWEAFDLFFPSASPHCCLSASSQHQQSPTSFVLLDSFFAPFHPSLQLFQAAKVNPFLALNQYSTCQLPCLEWMLAYRPY